jgi:hypothetical protein
MRQVDLSGRAVMIQDTKESLQHVYREGIFTRALGRPNSSNPYPAYTTEHLLWEKGWRLIDATHSERAVDEFEAVLAANYAPQERTAYGRKWLLRATFWLGLGAVAIWSAAYSSLLR